MQNILHIKSKLKITKATHGNILKKTMRKKEMKISKITIACMQ